jgi:hypothetical protein
MTRAGRLAFATIVCALALAAPAAADGPGVGTPAVVTLGDSAISGEAGRWAGNTNGAPGRVDALGPTAYRDTAAGESIPRCHRSKAAQAFIGDGVLGYDLGCSGATTAMHGTAPGEDFKPGIDFYSDAQGRMGQARALQDLAATRNVKAVVGRLEEQGVASWTSPGAVDGTEWLAQIRTISSIIGPYQLQESSHASYWGQLAMRNCLRLAYNGGAVQGGRCVRAANGLTTRGEPQMTLQP